jgi:uncharacterized protein YjiS (DUF1127 family)
MSVADFAPADRSAPSPLQAVIRWFTARREAHAKSEALQSLLFAPDYLLRDVGISRHQLIQEIEARRRLWRS